MSLSEVMRRAGVDTIDEASAASSKKHEAYALYTHSAIFAEVKLAVYHATGRQVRDLPITLDTLL